MYVHFIGTQGTGKTTLLNQLAEESIKIDSGINFKIITNVVRNLVETEGVKINKKGSSKSQNIIFEKYFDIFTSLDGYIDWVSDRSLIDVVAYTKYLYDHKKTSKKCYEAQIKWLKLWYDRDPKIKNTIFVYFPIEFEVVSDGVRSLDEEYRREIDNNIKSILNELGINYYVIEGTQDERLEMMKNIVWLNE